MHGVMTASAERATLAFSRYPALHPERLLPAELPLAAVLAKVEERCGGSHLAYRDVLSLGNLPHFAVGLL
jgi:hypothetical protein